MPAAASDLPIEDEADDCEIEAKGQQVTKARLLLLLLLLLVMMMMMMMMMMETTIMTMLSISLLFTASHPCLGPGTLCSTDVVFSSPDGCIVVVISSRGIIIIIISIIISIIN